MLECSFTVVQMLAVKKIWNALKTDCHRLKSETEGRRFRNFREYKLMKRRNQPPMQRYATISFALLLIVVGAAIGWLPGPGGFLAVIGLAMLAPEVPFIASALDYCEITARRLLLGLKRAWNHSRFGKVG